jgi:DeoR/GlpR family transcriptional regulator of sugar metabolism
MALQDEILEYLEDGKHVTIRQICDHTHARKTWVASALNQMVEQNQVLSLGRLGYANSPPTQNKKYCSAAHPPMPVKVA